MTSGNGPAVTSLSSVLNPRKNETLDVTSKTPDDGHRNCPKHVEFYSKNKFEKLLHLVSFIIRIYHDAQSHESQINPLAPELFF